MQRKKQIIIAISSIVVILLICVILFAIIKSNNNYYTVQYQIVVSSTNETTEVAGEFIGETNQKVKHGKNALPVTLIPKVGYKLLGWRIRGKYDGCRELERTETNVKRDLDIIAVLEGPKTVPIRLTTSYGGRIYYRGDPIGKETKCEILYGDKISDIVAVPDEEFVFVEWSNGAKQADYSDGMPVYDSDVLLAAKFERTQRKCTFDYNGADGNNEEKEIVLSKRNYRDILLPVPEKEGYVFEGWYGDWRFVIPVSDDKGNIIVNEEWFSSDSDGYLYGNSFVGKTGMDWDKIGYWDNDKIVRMGKLYAKWKPITTAPQFKVLLVYVTEIQAELTDNNGNPANVSYSMTNEEQQYLITYSQRIEHYLNALVNFEVDFRVDCYFTTQTVTEQNFDSPSDGTNLLGTGKVQTQMPEIADMAAKYDYIMTVYTLEDYGTHMEGGILKWGERFNASSGLSYYEPGFGGIRLDKEAILPPRGNEPPETRGKLEDWSRLESQERRMNQVIEQFVCFVSYELYEVCGIGPAQAARYYNDVYAETYGKQWTSFVWLGSYMLGRYVYEGEYVGIPFEYWTRHGDV